MAASASATKVRRILDPDARTAGTDIGWFVDTLLRLTSQDDRRLRSKYSSALKYAAAHHVPKDEAEGFIKRKGGLNECARLLRVRRRKDLL